VLLLCCFEASDELLHRGIDSRVSTLLFRGLGEDSCRLTYKLPSDQELISPRFVLGWIKAHHLSVRISRELDCSSLHKKTI
jgi:hypothetical protein